VDGVKWYKWHCEECGYIIADWDFGPYGRECPWCTKRIKAKRLMYSPNIRVSKGKWFARSLLVAAVIVTVLKAPFKLIKSWRRSHDIFSKYRKN